MSDPELKNNDRETSGEGFVRERIVNKSSSRRAMRKLLLTCVCGILFGVLAGITLAAVFPVASEWFAPEETSPSITIPKDERPSASESGEETTEETTPDETESEEESTQETETTEPVPENVGLSETEIRALVDEMLQDALSAHSTDPNALGSACQALALLGKSYNKAVVTIVMKDAGTDWFENRVETSGECAGIIWNEGMDGSLYVLSGGVLPETDAALQVIFHDGSRREALLCGVDRQTGLVILKVTPENIDDELREKIAILPLGNSYVVTKGIPVFVLGSLVGDAGAIVPAVVTYTEGTVPSPDGMYRKLYLNCALAEGANGFAVSLEGEVLGIITPETSGSVTAMIGISDLKGVLELLANGQQVPYLGIMGQTVTADIQKEYGLPAGVYVNEVIVDSPAYEAGIKAGDVIVSIGNSKIATIWGMRTVIEELQAETEVKVVIQRAGNGEYQTLEFALIPLLR
ncbi:MAG: serine protease [Lachnospiraceae bacterium]|nr:serine protease [Lachnospiraceae bacterium]